MKRKHILLIVLGLQMLFIFFPSADTPEERKLIAIYPFLFSNSGLTPAEYVYYLCEHLSLIVLCMLLYIESHRSNKFYMKVFLGLMVVDLVDYLLSFNQLFLPIGDLEVTWNVLQFGILLMAVLFIRNE